jgi:hypothetical protein
VKSQGCDNQLELRAEIHQARLSLFSLEKYMEREIKIAIGNSQKTFMVNIEQGN